MVDYFAGLPNENSFDSLKRIPRGKNGASEAAWAHGEEASIEGEP